MIAYLSQAQEVVLMMEAVSCSVQGSAGPEDSGLWWMAGCWFFQEGSTVFSEACFFFF